MSRYLINAAVNKLHILESICNICYSPECTDVAQVCNNQNADIHLNSTPTTEHIPNGQTLQPAEDVNEKDTINMSTALSPSENQPKYPSNATYCREFRFQRKGLHICNLNIRHVKPKLDDIHLLLYSSNHIDILGLCETFLNQNTEDFILNMQGYHIERKDRYQCNLITPDNGGGVLIYIANHLNYVRRNDLESQNIESIWLEVKLKKQ